MIKRYSVILFFLLTISPFAALAQNVQIRGTLYDNNKNTIPSVLVIKKQHDQLRESTLTDALGQYRLSVSKGDSIHIIYKLLGYQEVDILIPQLDKDIALNVVLKQQITALDSVTVEGKSKTWNMTVDIFDIKDRAYLLDSNIESLLTSLPGVSSTNELSSQYKVRGGNFDENIVYINGVEVYRPLLVRNAEQEGLSIINPLMVQSVAFSTGGYNAEYGDIMSSVLDINYKKPSKAEGTVATSLMDGTVYVGNTINKFSQISSIRYKTTESLLKTTDTTAEYDPSFMDVQSFMTFDFTPRWQLSFLGNYSRDSYKFQPQTRSTTFGTLQYLKNLKIHFNGWEKDRFITYQTALNLKGQVSDKVKLELAGSYFSSDEQERYDISGKYRLTELVDSENTESSNELLGVGGYHEHARNKLDMDVYDLKHTGDWKLAAHTIKWGLTLRHERYEDKIREWEIRDSAGYLLPNTAHAIGMYSNLRSDNKVSSTRYTAFLQDRFQLNAGIGLFIATVGVRGSYWNFNKEFLVSPRASLFYIPTHNKNLTFRLAGGLYHQAPFYKEYQQILQDDEGNNYMKPNENIKSQKAIHIIAGSDYSFKAGERGFKFTSEIYYKHLSNFIPYTINNVKIRYAGVNKGDGYIAGLDLRLFGEFVSNTTSWISFSLMKTQQKTDGIKAPLPTDQRYGFSIYLQDYMAGYERLKVSLKGVFADGLPFTAPNSSFNDRYFRTSAYKRVDLGFSWQALGENYAIRRTNSFAGAFKNIWLGLEVFNLFDMKNVNTYYWVSDIQSNQYAVPNYLTGRQLNIKLLVDF